MSPAIVRATPSDLRALQELAREGDLSLDVAAELARPHGILLLARAHHSGPPLGLLSAWHVADELHVLDVFTRPSARRRGVGRSLVATILEEGRSRSVRLVLLEVRRSNRAARALYESFGFRTAHVRPRYYADPPEDGLEMRLERDPTTGHYRSPAGEGEQA